MPALTIKLEGEGAWPDLPGRKVIHLADDARAEIAGLAHGMQSGAPSIALRLDLPDGRVVVYETSLALLLMAADTLKATLGDPRQ